MEKKTFNLEVQKSFTDDDYIHVTGYASTHKKDLVGDIVEAGAFTKSLDNHSNEGRIIPLLFNHNTSMPVGVVDMAKEDEKGLYFEARLPKSDPFVANTIKPHLDLKTISTLSIGFNIAKKEYKDGIRHLKEVDLHEISLVVLAANPDATICNVKAIEELETLKDVEELLHTQGFSNKQCKTIISKINALKQSRDETDAAREEQCVVKESLKGIFDRIENLSNTTN